MTSPQSAPLLSMRCAPMRSCRKYSSALSFRAAFSGISMVHCRSSWISSGVLISANFTSARSRCGRLDSIVTSRVRSSSGDTRVTAESSAKRLISSVHGSTFASPRTPCALRMTPTAIRLIKNIEDISPARFLTGSREQRAHGARRAALTPDDFSEVVGGDLELDDGGLVALVRANSHRVGIVDQRLGDELDQLFHLAFLRSDFTVGDSCAPLLTQ